ncbi:MAG: protein kinase [bacterium]|nr:protein kinase [bacterium]
MPIAFPAPDTFPAPRLQLQVGGTLTPGEHIYIVRPADDELLRWLQRAEFCNILTSRQMGKSSLVVRTAARLSEQGIHLATLEATQLGRPTDAATWYQALLEEIVGELRLEVEVRSWWRNGPFSTPHQRFVAFLRRELLPRLSGLVVIAIDEIDTMLRLSYRDEILATIRSIYNQRSKRPEYRRISFCLVGAAAPNELTIDKHTTPYNIGRTIELQDFDIGRDDLRLLFSAVANQTAEGEAIVRSILRWTGGHPYLTLRLCQAYIYERCTSPSDVDRLVDGVYGGLNTVRSDPHFQWILRFLGERLFNKDATFALYHRILRDEGTPDEDTLPHLQLRLSGLVKRNQHHRLTVRNRIYRRIFTKKWAEENLQLGHRGQFFDVSNISKELESLYGRRKRLTTTGKDAHSIDLEILEVKRLLRRGAELRNGDFLADGRFKLAEPIGQGGFAVVWKAWDRSLKQYVALKILHAQHSRDRSRLERFFRGARKMSSLRHPNIVRILESEIEDEGRFFFAMEYISGGNFQEAVLGNRLLLAERIRIILETGSALNLAHQIGIVHRDVKPSNILLNGDDRAKLTDFDLVRAADTTGGTRTGMLGTFVYAAPEALSAAKDVSTSADVFSLAMTAVFAIYGKALPLDVFRDTSRFISELEISYTLRNTLTEALAWEPAHRTASVEAFCKSVSEAIDPK